MRTVKVGMIGAGAIAETHVSGILRHPQAEMVAIADPSRERREVLAKRHHISHTYASAEELLSDCRVSAVSIAVPNAFHAEVALAALRAGKHVLLEKPFAPSLPEAQEVAELARRCGKVFTVGMNQRFAPSAQAIREAVQSGQLGHVYHAKTYWMRRAGIPKLGTWFCRKDMSGGGVMLDIGVHMVDLSLYLLQNFDVEAVSAATYSQFGVRGLGEGGLGLSDPQGQCFDVEDFATALLRLRGGATVAVDVSWALNQEQAERHDLLLFGTDGGASVYPQPRIFTRPDAAGSYNTLEPSTRHLTDAPCRFVNWIDAILGRAELVCTVDQALKVQAAIDAIYESARTGHEVRLSVSPRRTLPVSRTDGLAQEQDVLPSSVIMRRSQERCAGAVLAPTSAPAC